MNNFTLTIQQLERIMKEAKSNENQEDMLRFEIKNGRLIVSQYDWGHERTTTLMNKPC